MRLEMTSDEAQVTGVKETLLGTQCKAVLVELMPRLLVEVALPFPGSHNESNDQTVDTSKVSETRQDFGNLPKHDAYSGEHFPPMTHTHFAMTTAPKSVSSFQRKDPSSAMWTKLAGGIVRETLCVLSGSRHT
eukprot:2595490-Amphidinium_carterae.1